MLMIGSIPGSKLIFDRQDHSVYVNFDEQYLSEYKGRVVISFSAWSPTGFGSPFGFGFFKKHSIPTYFICQKRNHWWHSSEMLEIINLISESVKDRRLMLYGSSMGGYGAIYYAEIFKADVSLAIAPQTLVKDELVGKDLRWKDDWSKLIKVFDEKDTLKSNLFDGVRLVMGDTHHFLDSIHLDFYGCFLNAGNLLIPLPFVMHDAARVLVKSDYYKNLLLGLARGEALPNFDGLRLSLSKLYEVDDKAYFNFLRNQSIVGDEFSSVLNRIEGSWDVLDFEAMYMASEILLKSGNLDKALHASIESIRRYTGKTVPAYLIEKHKVICRGCL